MRKIQFLNGFIKKEKIMTVKWKSSFNPKMKIFTSQNARNNFTAQRGYIITGPDFKRVSQQIRFFENCLRTNFESIDIIKKKMADAFLVPSREIPDNVVTMNSVVLLKILKTGKVLSLKLVFPEFENYREYKISVFSALGASISLGKIGEKITYSTWKAHNKIKILDIPYQPEANGEYLEKS
jgi:regulator of nucleoside diphosphate kinase